MSPEKDYVPSRESYRANPPTFKICISVQRTMDFPYVLNELEEFIAIETNPEGVKYQ